MYGKFTMKVNGGKYNKLPDICILIIYVIRNNLTSSPAYFLAVQCFL